MLRRHVVGEEGEFPGWGWWPAIFPTGRKWNGHSQTWAGIGKAFISAITSTRGSGLLCLCLFSDIGSQGGRTLVVEGSHHLCHPFLIHAASPNDSGVPRFMCNRTSPLKEKLRIAAAGAADESPLERSGLNFDNCAQYHPYRLLN
ncbi:hypothetical protein [Paenibacillus agaridevorans]|uniref:hypothetical protein n=1 Tax=Paenibacillus agaridevorans TaxID=171404 RepID=UPI001BE412F7|nr:hypothetical protein [Paenibacillus agaridevorans]